MPHADSIDKIVTVYLASVCRRAFSYKGRDYVPRPLIVSPLIFRGYTCPPECGGCCPRFSLDYLPSEKTPYPLEEREIGIDGRLVRIMSDLQRDRRDHFCKNLDRVTGRCAIHGQHPFSCDFELIRFLRFEEKTVQTQKLFNRGWAMLRVDQGRGAKCQMLPADVATVLEVVRKLMRLQKWADHFGIDTHLPRIIAWARRGPHDCALRIP
jgi:Fe-S-cluster containining protein